MGSYPEKQAQSPEHPPAPDAASPEHPLMWTGSVLPRCTLGKYYKHKEKHQHFVREISDRILTKCMILFSQKKLTIGYTIKAASSDVDRHNLFITSTHN